MLKGDTMPKSRLRSAILDAAVLWFGSFLLFWTTGRQMASEPHVLVSLGGATVLSGTLLAIHARWPSVFPTLERHPWSLALVGGVLTGALVAGVEHGSDLTLRTLLASIVGMCLLLVMVLLVAMVLENVLRRIKARIISR
jgi:hypothetical protein